MSGGRAVLFDMDGVIFDSERAQRACWQAVGDRLGLGDLTEVYRDCVGVTEAAAGEILARAYGPDFDWHDFRRQSTALYLERYGESGLPLKPGVGEILTGLHARGVPLALATSTKGELARRFLARAGVLDKFDEVVTGDQIRRSKPDPEIFLTACARLGAAPEASWVVEDSFNGVRAAHAGGFHTLMVPDLLTPDGEMEALADVILPSLFEAKAYLERVL